MTLPFGRGTLGVELPAALLLLSVLPLFFLPLLIDRGQIPEQAAGLAKARIERVGINCHGPAL